MALRFAALRFGGAAVPSRQEGTTNGNYRKDDVS